MSSQHCDDCSGASPKFLDREPLEPVVESSNALISQRFGQELPPQAYSTSTSTWSDSLILGSTSQPYSMI